MRTLLAVLLLSLSTFSQVAPATNVTANPPTSSITGVLQTATGGTVNEGTLTFVLSQPAIVSGTSSLVPSTVSCYTSSQGNIVGLPDPQALPIVAPNTGSGTLAAGTYYVEIVYFYSTSSSLPSPEMTVTLSSQGSLIITAPAIQPNAATGYAVYIGSTSGGETLQGTVTGWGTFTQSSALQNGAALPTTNTSSCNLWFSDSMIPTGTYYTVNLVNQNGSQMAGYPQTWCTFGGAGGTINVSNGAPTGNCGTNGVYYPTPIYSTAPNNGSSQSIGGSLSVSGNLNAGGNQNVTGNQTVGGTVTAQQFKQSNGFGVNLQCTPTGGPGATTVTGNNTIQTLISCTIPANSLKVGMLLIAETKFFNPTSVSCGMFWTIGGTTTGSGFAAPQAATYVKSVASVYISQSNGSQSATIEGVDQFIYSFSGASLTINTTASVPISFATQCSSGTTQAYDFRVYALN